MTESWERITALFGAARLLDSDARRAFLDAACGDDAVLRTEVDRLLADSSQEDNFLREPLWRASTSFPAPDVSPGDILNARYRIDEHVATGGQAVVYRATDTVLNRCVIVKIMRGHERQGRLIRSRFECEMKALSQIDHPSVVGIFDVGELPDGCPFLVIQYVTGVSLREALRQGPFEPARVAGLLRDLASALGAAHAAGVAHRDLKPENIMLQRVDDERETLKLIDFGISHVDAESAASSLVIAGTIRYMAPEQFQGEGTPASDIYSLAIVVCEMLCGHPDSRALPPSMVGIRTHVEAALVFRPEDRPRDVVRWADGVACALVEAPRSRFRRRTWIASAAAAALVVFAVAVMEAPHASPREPGLSLLGGVLPAAESRSNQQQANGSETAVGNVSGEWHVTGILTVCGLLCDSPVGTVYQSTVSFSHDAPSTFHGTYFERPVRGTLVGNSVTFGYDGLVVDGLAARGNCFGTIAGHSMTLNCSEYLKPKSSPEFQLNGTRLDTVVKR